MEEPFDYSKVPFGFGMCAAGECPAAATCLRQIALSHVPADVAFLPTLNPNLLKAVNKKCRYYCSNEKIRFAKGFLCTVNALTLEKVDIFRERMIAYLGRRNFYKSRRGELLLAPAKQRYVIALAKELGVVQNEYFDCYIDDYNWDE